MKTNLTRRGFIAGSAAAAGALTAPGILHAQTTTLKISHYLPPTHGVQTDLIEPWAKKIKQQSHGAIDFKIYDGSTAFGRADRQADQVRAGVVDIAFGLADIPRGRFPHTSVIEMPFVVAKAAGGSKALWQLYKDHKLGGEYDDYHVLLLMTHDGALIHTVDTPVKQLSDLKGLRLRTPGPTVNALLDYEGASSITLSPSQIYESLEKGAIDGLATTWDLVATVHANEVLHYHTDCRLYGAAFHYVMNKRSYARLPQDMQQLIARNSGQALLAQVGGWWKSWEMVGRQDAVKRGDKIITIDDATRDQWRKQVHPMIEKYLAGLKSKGVKNPDTLYRTALDLVHRYSA